MIQIVHTDYIVGVWMCEQTFLGKVYILVIKGQEEDAWVYLVKFFYNNQNFNLFSSDSDHKNIRNYKNKSEIDMIKLAKQEAEELSILFNHHTKGILIGGNLDTYASMCDKANWLPALVMLPKEKKKKKII